jgi:hypothetical protein
MVAMTLARLFAASSGAVLVLTGVAGFAGLVDVTTLHDLAHLATGLPGLVCARAGDRASRAYALALGVVYVAFAASGLEPVLHLGLALAAFGVLIAGRMTSR